MSDEEKYISIGHMTVPDWQFDLYKKEAFKNLELLNHELTLLSNAPPSKSLIRAIHTLSGTTNTIGIDKVAKLGLPLENWLTLFTEKNPDSILESNLLKNITDSGNLISSMVTDILNQLFPQYEYDHLIELWTSMHQKELTNDIESENESSDLNFDSLSDFDNIDNLLNDISSIDANPTHIAQLSNDTSKEESYIKSNFEIVIKSLLDFNITDDVDESIKDIFLEEATDIFNTLPNIISAWRNSNGNDSEKASLIKRAMHTLKGSARMAGYQIFGEIVHNLETALDEGWLGLHKNDLPELLQIVVDYLAEEVSYYQGSSASSGIEDLKAYTNNKTNKTEIKIEHPSQEISTTTIINEVNNINALESVIEEFELLPLKDDTHENNSQIKGYRELMAKQNNSQEEDIASVLRVPTAKIDLLSNHLGKTGTIQLKIESAVHKVENQVLEMTMNMDRLRRLLKEVEIQAETQMKSRIEDATKEGLAFDPLEFDRFTRLQELTRMTAEAMNDINNSHTEISKGLVDIQDGMHENAIVSDDMQHSVMSVRTVAVSSLKARLDRLIRQACRDTAKSVDLYITNEAEVDSGVLNKVIAPIEHLVRNSIAHGIEKPDKRKLIGKPEAGSVKIEVKLKGNDIIFSISDDGAGINRKAVEDKAKEKGLIAITDTITQEKANELIFDQGFSTASQVSALSGRGVGMDVVQTDIAALGGRIIVKSESGLGTSFDLIVPSYMSVMSMVPVSSKKTKYAIPATLIQDIVVVRDNEILTAYESGIMNYNNQTYDFYGLSEVNGGGQNDIVRNNRVLIIADNNNVVAVHIDGLEPDKNLVMKPLCRTISSLPGLMGSTVAGDGTPLLVINPIYLKSTIIRQDRTIVEDKVTIKKAKTRADTVVMVVDDSLTVRRITQKFLDREGFKTIVAKDGLDAIEKINDHGCPDLILSDIAMPNMDGFQLVEHIRTAVSKTVPIIMISSRSIDKYESHAKSLGVNKSIGKPYQEPELLEAIEQLTGLVDV